MTQVPVKDAVGNDVQTIDLPAYIFEEDINEGLMHQAYVRQMANARQGNHKTKKRSEVRMTGAKVYRQKGTGRARHGARSAPIFVGGGIAWGPQPRKYTKDMPKKMRRKAIRSALSALLRDDQLVFVDGLNFTAPKTRQMREIIATLTGGESALVVLGSKNENVARSVHNLPKAHIILANYLNIRDLLKYDKVIIPLDALDVIASIWGDGRVEGTYAQPGVEPIDVAPVEVAPVEVDTASEPEVIAEETPTAEPENALLDDAAEDAPEPEVAGDETPMTSAPDRGGEDVPDADEPAENEKDKD